MKSPLFIFFITTHFILLKSMDVKTPEDLIKYAKIISRHNQEKINEFDAACRKIWVQKNLTMHQFTDEINNLVTTYEQTAPFFLIGDCAKETCALARCNNPDLREAFENKASVLLKEKIVSHPDRPINLTSLCPSGVFSEMIILTKTLVQRPTAHINIHLIDNGYQQAIQARKEMGLTSHINSEHPLFLDKRHISDYLKNLPLTSYSFNEKRQLFIQILFAEMQHKQFLSYLTNTFWNATLSLYFYQSVDEYLFFSPFIADVVTTVDIANEGYDSNPYGLLCLATLHANPESTNIALDNVLVDKNSNNAENSSKNKEKCLGPCLFSYAIEGKRNKQTKAYIVGLDNKNHMLYVSYQQLTATSH